MIRSRYRDVFNPVLVNPLTGVANLTIEQIDAIHAILDVACSDSAFADKAYAAIHQVVSGGYTKSPVVGTLVPSNVELGSASFTLRIHGSNFNQSSVIIFAGQEEPTTIISDKEVTTGVDMSVWLGPDSVPVEVMNSDTGVVSNSLSFTFIATEPALFGTSRAVKSDHSIPSHSVPSHARVDTSDSIPSLISSIPSVPPNPSDSKEKK
jgi:hypothetical protein